MFDADALLRGDESALCDVIDTLSPELYRYAAGILLSRADAADAVQNAFLSLCRTGSPYGIPARCGHICTGAPTVPPWISSEQTAGFCPCPIGKKSVPSPMI